MARRAREAFRTIRVLRTLAPASPPRAAAALVAYAAVRVRLKRAGVRGFCPLPHGLVLFWLARFGGADGPVVEIGSAWGLSTIVLAHASSRPVVTVDTHEGSGLMERADSFAEFTANVERLGVAGRVRAHRATSHELAAGYADGPAALLYVDGLHTFAGVSSDIDDWLPLVQPDAFVVFDDYGDAEFEVRRAVDAAAAAGRLRSVLPLYGIAVARPGR